MSPNGRNRGNKVKAANNLYTVILVLAFAVVLATAAFVTYKCYTQYGTILKITKPTVPRLRSF
ncbi:MAG: hypothetical protein ACYS9T_04105 [Planctomycetota bacterium]